MAIGSIQATVRNVLSPSTSTNFYVNLFILFLYLPLQGIIHSFTRVHVPSSYNGCNHHRASFFHYLSTKQLYVADYSWYLCVRNAKEEHER